MSRVQPGDRFAAIRDLTTTGLSHWLAPYTGSFESVIPEGTILVALDDIVETAPGFGCIPERYDELEATLVPEADRLHPKYSSYSFVFLDTDIGARLEQLLTDR